MDADDDASMLGELPGLHAQAHVFAARAARQQCAGAGVAWAPDSKVFMHMPGSTGIPVLAGMCPSHSISWPTGLPPHMSTSAIPADPFACRAAYGSGAGGSPSSHGMNRYNTALQPSIFTHMPQLPGFGVQPMAFSGPSVAMPLPGTPPSQSACFPTPVPNPPGLVSGPSAGSGSQSNDYGSRASDMDIGGKEWEVFVTGGFALSGLAQRDVSAILAERECRRQPSRTAAEPPFSVPAVPMPLPGTPPCMASFGSHSSQSAPLPTPVPNPPLVPNLRADSDARRGKVPVVEAAARGCDVLYRSKGYIDACSSAPQGFPMGPIQGSEADLEEAVKLWCRNVKTGGGGFAVVRPRSMRDATSKSGTRRAFGCRPSTFDEHDVRCKCGWMVEYEFTTAGWVVHHANFTHTGNDHLVQQSAEMMTDHASRVLPQVLVDVGDAMARQGLPLGSIKRVIDGEALRMNIEISWDYRDIRTRFAPSAADKEHDATGIIETLEDRRRRGLEFMTVVDSDCRIQGLFIENEHGAEEYARGGIRNTVLFDPTASTNRYRLKLCPFTTVSPSGQTVVLAYVLIHSESLVMFEWAFKCFVKVFKVEPLAFFTDGDANIARALDSIRVLWPKFHHFLCIFHLSKNLYTHLHPLYIGNVDGWRTVHSEWWRIAKETDTSSKDQFDSEFDAFIALVGRTAKGNTLQTQLGWLSTMKVSKHKWAARYVWSVCTWGIHSTQRAEAMQSALKGILVASMMLTEVHNSIEKYNVLSRAKRDISDIRRVAKVHNLSSLLPPWIREALLQITPYAQSMLIEQYKQSLNYQASDESPDGKWTVKRLTTSGQLRTIDLKYDDSGFVLSYVCGADFGFSDTLAEKSRTVTRQDCSCQYEVAFGGLPCRHELCVYSKRGVSSLPVGNIQSKWLNLSAAQNANNLNALRRFVAPSGGPVTPASTLALTRAERKIMILDLARDVAELGSVSDEALWAVRQDFSNLCKVLSSKENSAATGTSVTDPAVRRKEEMKSLLGHSRRLANFAINEHLFKEGSSTLRGRPVLVLWNAVGWQWGVIVDWLGDDEKEYHDATGKAGEKLMQCNFSVKYTDTTDPVKHILVKEMYYNTDARTLLQHTWGLVEDCPLDSGVAASDIRPPPSKSNAGPYASKRLKPASGPTSALSKGGKGGKRKAASSR